MSMGGARALRNKRKPTVVKSEKAVTMVELHRDLRASRQAIDPIAQWLTTAALASIPTGRFGHQHTPPPPEPQRDPTEFTVIASWSGPGDPEEWPFPTEHTLSEITGGLAERVRARAGADDTAPVFVLEHEVSGGYSEWTQENDYPFTVLVGGDAFHFDGYWHADATLRLLLRWLDGAQAPVALDTLHVADELLRAAAVAREFPTMTEAQRGMALSLLNDGMDPHQALEAARLIVGGGEPCPPPS